MAPTTTSAVIPLFVQQGLERGVAKGIRVVLDHHRLTRLGRHGVLDLDARAARDEDRRLGAARQVLHMDHQQALAARSGDHPGGIGDGAVDAAQRQVASGEVFVLQIDDEDGVLAHV